MIAQSNQIKNRNPKTPIRFVARTIGGILLCQFLFTGQAFASETYTVKKGDTWDRISKAAGYPASELMALNNKKNNFLAAGELIQLPESKKSAGQPALNNKSMPGATYTVVKGDTLYSIAERFGSTIKALKQENKLTKNSIKAGQKLKIQTLGETIAIIVGAADANSVEFKVDSEYQVFRVPNRSGEVFQGLKGKKVKLTYKKANNEIITYTVQ
ncbi:LysM peptidoglycan-binding domain-containing protein [Peribacillus saganii]|uniref:LysM peptidoglycan-binding domain-containing protein n=1 Tax=Peribacillus saganii TaxID=2303992 RepID=A0A372LR86_9BACI|nr:LysM peptidoglycan-binding domain-containing protein [Peribacillus saganii]RFU70437.1 LysM peptidoglycan-binding domain-containing protein [Peribacillus saganii]